MEDNIFKKVPNWLRYILAIPIGIVGTFIAYFLLHFCGLWYISPDSTWYSIGIFLFRNFFNILAFFYAMNYTLPKHQLKITLTLSIILGVLYSMFLGLYVFSGTMTLELGISFFFIVAGLIISCFIAYYSFKVEDTNIITTSSNNDNIDYISNHFNSSGTTTPLADIRLPNNNNLSKYTQLLDLLSKNLGVNTLDDIILTIYDFYNDNGYDMPSNLIAIDNLSIEEKRSNLLQILEIALNTKGIDNVLSELEKFYSEINGEEDGTIKL